jgi:hypothetical protein
MRTRPLRFLAVPLLALALLLGGPAGCAGDGGSSIDDPLLEGQGIEVVEGAPASGNVHVTLRTWDPDTGREATFVLVNATSEVGQKLRSGRATSTVTRVLDDDGMGSLLATLDQNGFAGVSADGVSLDTLGPDSRRKGVIVVERDGSPRSLVSESNVGKTVATVFRDCKVLILQVHGSIPGAAASASTGDSDPERTFQAPPIKMKR